MNEASVDSTFHALADPTRRAILGLLAHGEARVTDVALPFDVSLNSISKHIRVLERADLVRRHRIGRDHFLSLNHRQVDEAARWMQARAAEWNQRLARLAKVLDEDDA